jgi:hypothetical protein
MFDLSQISKLITGAAFDLGGSDIAWYRADFCPYVKDNGDACYDERRGSSWIECPICGGTGSIYRSPKYVKGIYVDNSNKFLPDGNGGFLRGEKTLSLPANLNIEILKPRNSTDSRRVLRDKFEILGYECNPDGTRKIIEMVFLAEDPVKPVINSSVIYQTVMVQNNF